MDLTGPEWTLMDLNGPHGHYMDLELDNNGTNFRTKYRTKQYDLSLFLTLIATAPK